MKHGEYELSMCTDLINCIKNVKNIKKSSLIWAIVTLLKTYEKTLIRKTPIITKFSDLRNLNLTKNIN